MKFLLSALLTAALAITPAMAQENKLETVPENILVEGLNTIAVCMVIDAIAVTTLSNIAQDAPSDEIKQMKGEAQDLVEALILESQFGNEVMKVLVDKYHHTNDDIGKNLQELTDTTRKELTDKVKDVPDYYTFKAVYETRLWSCNQALNSWFEKIKEPGLKPEKK